MITRRSARANKGQHSKRDLDDVVNDTPKQTRAKRPSPDPRTDSDGEVRCTPCETTKENYNEDTDTGGTFIQCESCSTWQHAECMGFKQKKTIPESYRCNICDPTLPVKKRKIETKTEDKTEAKVEEPAKPQPVGLELLKTTLKNDTRLSTAKAFFTYFKKLFAPEKPDDDKEREAGEWAVSIENLIFTTYPWKRYIEEGRRILFLLKKYFMADILANKLTFEELIHKTPKEVNQTIEQVEMKVRKDIKNIILTRHEPLEIIRRTHRGDEVRENENDDEPTFDLNITTKKVDHRRFDVPAAEEPVTVSEPLVAAYQNFNPRIDDDDDVQYNDDEDEANKNNDDDDEFDKILSGEPTRKASLDDEFDKILAEKPAEKVALDDLPIRHKTDSLHDSSPKPSFWSGKITFPDFVSFNASTTFYSSTEQAQMLRYLDVLADIFVYPSYYIEGKFDRSRADAYLDKVLATRDLYVVQVTGSDSGFDTLFDYLWLKKRVGVLSGRPYFVKDSYLMAIDFDEPNLPQYLKLLNKGGKGMFALFTVKKGYETKNELKLGLVDIPYAESKSDLAAIMSQLQGGQEA